MKVMMNVVNAVTATATATTAAATAYLLCNFKFLYMITLGSLIESYPLFYHVLCAVSMILMCRGKCGIVILCIISSGKSPSSNSSALLCVGDIDLQLCLYQQFLSVVQGSSGILAGCCSRYAGIGGISKLYTFLVVAFYRGLLTVYIVAYSVY
ncbi:MAG: hypothetical protein EZS28_022125 [Streblomastix strix]|uniref:Uncharacterized protein n=1 Tax=Streblomastix strix TaxID=222440 RepID=A0A5J4VIQ2_9EUKA|nr:MAG: hypothetical protein EZS28_022125 [Streblomastix strix]